MSCKDNEHLLRAINPRIDVDGGETVGHPPESDEEPAWCRRCGALWAKGPFGLGWRWSHPTADRDAPTLLNILREARKKSGN